VGCLSFQPSSILGWYDSFRANAKAACVLIAVFFATSLISVVTGSTSLITVPVMIQFGIEPHVAVATNMLALVFMSIGGSLPFARKGVLSRERLPSLIAVTKMGAQIKVRLSFVQRVHRAGDIVALLPGCICSTTYGKITRRLQPASAMSNT
jgi:uncharacterized membrane protein YfcA